MTLHQILVAAAGGDAVTSIALEMRSVLRRFGPSEIYARYLDPDLAGDVLTIDELEPMVGAPIVFHASIGEPDIRSFLDGTEQPLILIYHNITPPHFFEGVDDLMVERLRSGREDLKHYRDRTMVAIADSSFNASELIALGYPDVRVCPPLVDYDALRALTPDVQTDNHLETVTVRPVFLSVGQLLPHKRPDVLLEAAHLLNTAHGMAFTLILVGAARVPCFERALQRQVEELNLPFVWIAGTVSPQRLATFYRHADVFVTATEHEGFCLPVVEAMAFGCPVVARAAGALTETVGDAGILLPEHADARWFAEAMAAVASSDHVKRALVQRGRRQAARFHLARTRTTFAAIIAELAAR